MCYFFRHSDFDLERTSVESEVFDFDVEGDADTSDLLGEDDSAVEVIEPADVHKVQYCKIDDFALSSSR